ncbi:MAG TPA: type I DNA topoisomerase [Candidatus Woesebacteria bacterium]|nr:type I DNA topoisomerase [Candidatus Woesebacteria bacterium]
MQLVIVESPTKARKLSSFLGKTYQVKASVGHVRDLPKSKLGVDLENNFEPSYIIPRGKGKVVKELQVAAKKADGVFLAMDPDREGEAIAWHVQQLLVEKGMTDKQCVRCTFHEITKEAVVNAINHPVELNINLVDAQQARRVLDRLVGYQVSPVLWKKIRYGLSAGRVQSVALRLIVEREREREAFKSQEYWEVEVAADTQLSKDAQSTDGGKKIKIFDQGKLVEPLASTVVILSLSQINGKKASITNQDEAEPVVKDLQTAEYVVQAVERQERTQQSKPPFTTSTLQQAAANLLGFSAKQTMTLAQQLYEEGLITYHRTDSMALSSSALAMSRDYISQTFGSAYLPSKPRVFRSQAKNAQEAHEAIRVTNTQVTVDQVQQLAPRLSSRHSKLYDLIWRRFLASQMMAVVYDQTTILVEATSKAHQKQKYLLKSIGSIMKFPGWRRLFPTGQDTLLPEIKPTQELNFLDINPLQKFTLPPPRYNDASLVKELEKRGIGRPSTYASIISVIQDRGYVDRVEKTFVPTAVGFTVCDFLSSHFQYIMDYEFTAQMEENLDGISRGEKNWREVLSEFWQPLSIRLEDVLKNAEKVQIPTQKTGESCPECGQKDGGEVVIRTGRYGKFLSCSRYPDCKFTKPLVETLNGFDCPLCTEGKVVIKPSRFGKSFYGCSRYPECDWASWKKPEKGVTISPAEWQEQQAKRAKKRQTSSRIKRRRKK